MFTKWDRFKDSMIIRDNCPFCGGDVSHAEGYGTRDKIWKWAPGAAIKRCGRCQGVFINKVPNQSAMEYLYKKHFPSVRSAIRFTNTFGPITIEGPVIEIGAGEGPVREFVKGDYYSVDPAWGDYPWLFDELTEDQIKKLRALNARTLVTLDCFEHVLYPRTFFENIARVLPTGARIYFKSGEIAQPGGGRLMMPHINCPSERTLDFLGKGSFETVKICGSNNSARILERTNMLVLSNEMLSGSST